MPPLLGRRALIAAAPAALLSGCRRSGRRTIGVVPKATSHLFFVSVHAGVDRAAQDLHVEVLWNGPNDETEYTRQIEIVDSMVVRGVAALAISAAESRALVAPLKRAMAAGIPVTMFDSAAEFDGYVSFIATDNHAAGSTAARQLAARMAGTGKVAMVMQKPGGTSTALREQGFAETIGREFPGIKIAGRQYGMADPARSRSVAEDLLTAHSDLSGMFASSEAASIGAIQAIRARGLSRKVRLVTFDSSRTHLDALRDGTADVMLVQDPFRLGYEAVKSLADKLEGRDPPRRTELPARVIVKADLEQPDVKALLRV